LTAIGENGHVFKAEGNKVHHEEEIMIVGGGIGGLCFVATLHRYDVIPFSNNYHDLMSIQHEIETIINRIKCDHWIILLLLEQSWVEGCCFRTVRQAMNQRHYHYSLEQCNEGHGAFRHC
jgi:hypothetical protein